MCFLQDHYKTLATVKCTISTREIWDVHGELTQTTFLRILDYELTFQTVFLIFSDVHTEN